MRPKTILTFLVVCGFLFWVPSVQADELDTPSLEEVIQHFATGTGFAQDSLELFFEADQDGLGKAQDYLVALNVLNKLHNAQDQEAFETLLDAAISKAKGKILEKILSNSAQTVLAALKLYWDALQLIKDYVLVPELDARVYKAYSDLRSHGGGTTNLPKEAFDQLAYGTFGNWTGVTYFALRDKMLDQLIKAKDYNKSVMGDKQLNDLKKQLDDFWMRRLEKRYQREVFNREWPKIKAQLEAEGQLIENRLRRGHPDVLKQILLKFPKDLPGNAWIQENAKFNGPPPQQYYCKWGCYTLISFLDKPYPHSFVTDRRKASPGMTYHQVNCNLDAVYTGKPIPQMHPGKVSVEERQGLPGQAEKDTTGTFPWEKVEVFYRGYALEVDCNSQRNTMGKSKFESFGTPELSHKATKYFIRKLLNRIDKLYEEGVIR